jgi:hypothetical protein
MEPSVRSGPLGLLLAIGCAAAAGPAGAEDPGARALQLHQLRRQQQQDALQLRMQQQQRATQSPATDLRQQQEARQLEIEQQQRQQGLHYRQGIRPPVAQPSDDAGTRGAKRNMELQETQRQGGSQLRRFDAETRRQAEDGRKMESRGEITPPQPQ